MKILLAIDGSKYSDATVQALAAQIRTENAQVLVLQIVEPRIYSTPPQMAAGYQPEMAEIMKEQFKQAQQKRRPQRRNSSIGRLRGQHTGARSRTAHGDPRPGQ